MPTTITERPYLFSFSENEIRYVFDVPDHSLPGCALEIQIFRHTILIENSPGLLAANFSLTPNPGGSVYCHIRDYLTSFLNLSMPNVNALTEGSSTLSNSTVYYIKYRTVTTANPNTEWTDDIANKRVVIWGGVEKMKFQRNNFFVNYLPTYKPFLTWRSPKGSIVAIDQVHFLSFLCVAEMPRIYIHAKTTFTDQSTDTRQITNSGIRLFGSSVHLQIKKGFVMHIQTGAKALGLDTIAPDKQISHYEIFVTTADGTILANNHRFYIDYRPVYSYHDFNYFNSLGGIDPIRIKGELSRNAETTGEEVEHIIHNDSYIDAYNILGTATPQEQFSETNITKRDTYKGDAGWSRSPREQEATLLELRMSRGIFELIDGRWIKVLNLKKTQELGKNTDKKWSLPIEWGYGYEDNVYTPKNVMLGPGTAD